MVPKQFLRKKNRPLCIAHRGASALAPENSLSAFQQAIECGADMIEFDLHLTQDDVPIVFHDSNLKRITGCSGEVEKKSLDQIKNYDVGKIFSAEFQDEKIPTLEEVLDLGQNKILFYVELKKQKRSNKKLVEKTLECLIKRKSWNHALIVSYEFDILEWVKQIDSRFLTGVNFRYRKKVMNWVKENPAKVDLLCAHFTALNPTLFDFSEKYHKPIYAWSSESPKILKKWGQFPQIQALVTNNPKIFYSNYPK